MLRRVLIAAALSLAAGCASTVPTQSTRAEYIGAPLTRAHELQVLDRIAWGASPASAQQIRAAGIEGYLEQQLRPPPAVALPPEVQAQIDALTISQRPFDELMFELEQQRRDFVAIQDPEQRNAARKVYQQALVRLGREAATRSVLRAVYSPNRLHEQMTWFWMNHFSVFQGKNPVRAMVGDYEERAIRPHALGSFRDLLGATATHPAMLRYLDNSQNAANRLNENYARELMELHTLGVGAGYTQRDVQELARILTGVGINLRRVDANVRPERRADYVRRGVFEFNPHRHDYGDKAFLGATVKGRGLGEVDEALDRLARHPATAHFVSRKLAVYFVADEPPPTLIEHMAQAFRKTDGDIAATLRVMFRSPEFAASLGRKFKDPMHYVVSAVRVSYGERPILDPLPLLVWLNRLGQGLYNRETPDGYPMTQAAWASPGQMTSRFEVARAIGSGTAPLFRKAGAPAAEGMVLPQLANTLDRNSLHKTLGPETLKALAQATSPQDWNTYFLSSPEFMHR